MQRIPFFHIYVFLFASALLVGCSIPINLPEGVEDQIPDGANRVDVISDQSVEELYEAALAWLPTKGFVIEDANEVSRTIETNGAEVGQRTTMKIKLRVNAYERGAKLEAIGSWSTDVEEATFDSAAEGISGEDIDWYPAVWQSSARGSYAYAQLANTFHEIPAAEKRYVKQ